MIWIIILVGAVAGPVVAPLAFRHAWTKKWFRILWWVAIVLVVVGFISQHR